MLSKIFVVVLTFGFHTLNVCTQLTLSIQNHAVSAWTFCFSLLLQYASTWLMFCLPFLHRKPTRSCPACNKCLPTTSSTSTMPRPPRTSCCAGCDSPRDQSSTSREPRRLWLSRTFAQVRRDILPRDIDRWNFDMRGICPSACELA